MAKVNNATAQKRWDSLKGSAGVSLKRIVQGQATSADYQRVMNILNQQSSLAGQVFSQQLQIAEIQAKKFQEAYQAVVGKDNKIILSAFEVALNAEMKKIAPDIVGQIKELLEDTVLTATAELERSMGSRFDEIRHLIPEKKDTPSVNDLLAANDLLAERIREDNASDSDKREDRLIEKIAHTFEGTLRGLAERINQEKAQRARTSQGHRASQPAQSVPKLSYGPAPVATAERQSVLQRGMALLRGPSSGGSVTTKSPTSGVSGSSGATTAVVALSPAAQHDLTTAADSQKSFYDRVKSLLPAPSPKDKDTGSAQQQDDESKKADTWWRSFKNWFGSDQDKKSKKSDRFGWLKGLGQLLALMILNPKLFKTLGEGMKNLLTWDNIKGAAEKSWDWVKGMASSVMEAIANMLGGTMNTPSQSDVTGSKDQKKDLSTSKNAPGDTKHADINNLTPEQKKQWEQMDKKNKAASGGPGWINSALSMVGIETPQMKAYKMGNTDTNQNSPTYGHVIINGKDQGLNPDFAKTAVQSAGSGRSSVGPLKPPLPANMPTGAAGSVTFSESPSIPMTPGIALPTTDATHMNVGSGSTQPQRGAPQMGIGSFGFNAANSDSLTLMNTYHFTAG